MPRWHPSSSWRSEACIQLSCAWHATPGSFYPCCWGGASHAQRARLPASMHGASALLCCTLRSKACSHTSCGAAVSPRCSGYFLVPCRVCYIPPASLSKRTGLFACCRERLNPISPAFVPPKDYAGANPGLMAALSMINAVTLPKGTTQPHGRWGRTHACIEHSCPAHLPAYPPF